MKIDYIGRILTKSKLMENDLLNFVKIDLLKYKEHGDDEFFLALELSLESFIKTLKELRKNDERI